MNDILKHLQHIGFSKIEAQVYVTLVKHPKLNGSQVAKILNLARSSVYSALNNLYSKGYIFLLPGESNIYKAHDPDVLLEQLKQDYIQSADALKDELKTIKTLEQEQEYCNIKGYQNFLLKTKELLLQAEEEVCMNTCFEPRIFAEELETIAKRGVRIIVFSFGDIDTGDLPVEFFRKHVDKKNSKNHLRMMLVVDLKKALIAGSYQGGEVLGTFTENPLLVDIVSEHIHLDVYLLKLQKKYRDTHFFNGIQLNSLLEKF
ncbi:MAG: TrmB family transcriptional regulator [bacterium]|nr:TrmB family transcriptional regulator [bacterium]